MVKPASISIEGSLPSLGDEGSQGCEHLSPSVGLQATCEGKRKCYSPGSGNLLGGNNRSPVACHVHPSDTLLLSSFLMTFNVHSSVNLSYSHTLCMKFFRRSLEIAFSEIRELIHEH